MTFHKHFLCQTKQVLNSLTTLIVVFFVCSFAFKNWPASATTHLWVKYWNVQSASLVFTCFRRIPFTVNTILSFLCVLWANRVFVSSKFTFCYGECDLVGAPFWWFVLANVTKCAACFFFLFTLNLYLLKTETSENTWITQSRWFFFFLHQ